jgi:hypothetical protein
LTVDETEPRKQFSATGPDLMGGAHSG